MRTFLAVGAVTVCLALVRMTAHAASADAPAKAPDVGKAAEALVITEADAGKTIRAAVGRLIEVRLEGAEATTGWEASGVNGKSVVREGAGPGEVNASQTPKFTPAKDAADKAIGTYAFRYLTVAEGKSGLRFVYVFPGGPEPVRRSATKLVRKMEVTIEVPPAAAVPEKGDK